MSLTFFVEAGAHGPIEPELIALQSAQQSSTYSGIYTSAGQLRANITYSHVIGQLAPAKTPRNNKTNINTTTPICFHAPVPAPSIGLLRQLSVLEWSGLHRLLSNVAADLENIAEDDLQLLMIGKDAAEIRITMPKLLANSALRNTRLLLLLALWLLHCRKLAQAEATSMADGLLWRLAVYDEENEVVSLASTSASSILASTRLKARVYNFDAMDARSAFAAAVGTPEQLLAWCRREKRDRSEVNGWVDAQGRSASSSIASPGRPSSIFSAATIESDSKTPRTERSSIFSIMSLRTRSRKSAS